MLRVCIGLVLLCAVLVLPEYWFVLVNVGLVVCCFWPGKRFLLFYLFFAVWGPLGDLPAENFCIRDMQGNREFGGWVLFAAIFWVAQCPEARVSGHEERRELRT